MRARDPQTGRYVKVVDAQPAQGLTAAVATLPTRDLDKLPRMAASWQSQAWRLWHLLGILRSPTSFKAKQVGRLGWNVWVNGEQLEPDAAEAAMNAIAQPYGVREVAERIALNLEVVGETYYARARDQWNVYGPTTPKLKEKLEVADIRVRGWNADPEDPNLATSSIQAALGTADQIRLMCALSRGQDRNRLSQRGILLVPKEGQFPEGDDFQSKLEASMTAPLANEYAASAVVPLKVDFPAEYIDSWRHLLIESPYDEKLMERIEKAVHQFALEIDMPPEVLLGNMDSNHWNAWLSSEENYRGYVEPLGNDTGWVFAQAMMEATSGAVTIEVTPDPSLMLMRSVSLAEAFEGLKNLVWGFDFVRRVAGADEDDAPTDDEIALILALQGRTVPGEEPVQEAPLMPEETPVPSSNGNGIAASAKSEEAELETLARRLTDMDTRLLSVLEGLAAMSVDHIRATMKAVEGVDGVGEQHVVANEVERLGKAWSREVSGARKALGSLGIDATGPEWDEAQALSVTILTEGITTYAMENIDKAESELPALPVLVLRQALATAGGSGSATVASVVKNPAPTFQDPQGFALGVLSLKDLKGQDVVLTQWRFRYGPLSRTEPFEPHKAADGQFMTSDGHTSQGYSPGDHRGCLCQMDPVFKRSASPQTVDEEVDV